MLVDLKFNSWLESAESGSEVLTQVSPPPSKGAHRE